MAYFYYCGTNPSVDQITKCAWPFLVCQQLRLENAEATWKLLPPEVRQKWHRAFPDMNVNAAGPLDGNLHSVRPNSMQNVVKQAEMPYDTKCAACRTMLVSGEYKWVALHSFKEGQWLRGGRATNAYKRPLAPMWERPSQWLTGKSFTRAALIYGILQYAVCDICAQETTKTPILSTVWPEEHQRKDPHNFAIPTTTCFIPN